MKSRHHLFVEGFVFILIVLGIFWCFFAFFAQLDKKPSTVLTSAVETEAPSVIPLPTEAPLLIQDSRKVQDVLRAVTDDEGLIDLTSLAVRGDNRYKEFLAMLSFQPSAHEVFRVFQSNSMLNSDNGFVSAATFLTFDSDGDGVPDDVEILHGLDPHAYDTIGDGKGDFAALQKSRRLAPIEKAFLEKKEIGQPVEQGIVDKAITIEQAFDTDNQQCSGKGYVGNVIALYLYDLSKRVPMLMTTVVNKNGEWKYVFSDRLKNGHYTLYATTNDQEGKVVKKSAPFTFQFSK